MLAVRQNTMQKMLVPFALAAALTLHSPFIRAGEGTRLFRGETRLELASGEPMRNCVQRQAPIGKMAPGFCERRPAQPGQTHISRVEIPAGNNAAQMDERALEVKAEPIQHDDNGKAGAPWWLSALAGFSALVNLGLFYGGTLRKVWKTKSTESFSKTSRLMGLAGSLLWVGYGLCLKDWVVVAMTSLALPGSICITCLKLKNRDKPKQLEPRERKISRITIGVAAMAVGALAATEFLLGNFGAGVLVTVMGGVAVFLRNLSPWTQAIKTMIDKSTKSFVRLPYILDPPSSAIWVFYGLAKGEVLVAASNLLSLAVEAIMAVIVVKNWKKDTVAKSALP